MIAQDFQDLQLQNYREAFIGDDGVHPVPALRPKIYNKTLGLMLSSLALDLDNIWEEQINDVSTVKYQGGSVYIADLISSGLSLDPTKPVDQTIKTIFDIFSGASPHAWWNNLKSTKNYDDIPSARELLFKNLSTFQALSEFSGTTTVILDTYSLPEFSCSDSESQTLIDGWMSEGEAANTKWTEVDRKPAADAPPKWLPVLKAGGWATKGPNGSIKEPR